LKSVGVGRFLPKEYNFANLTEQSCKNLLCTYDLLGFLSWWNFTNQSKKYL